MAQGIDQAGLQALMALGREMLAEQEAPTTMAPIDAPSVVAPAEDVVELMLGDLVGDDNGEVVLFNDSGLKALAIATDASLVGEGAADQHVTAAGDDVTGFRYLSFDNGVTLYYQDGLDVLVRSEQHS